MIHSAFPFKAKVKGLGSLGSLAQIRPLGIRRGQLIRQFIVGGYARFNAAWILPRILLLLRGIAFRRLPWRRRFLCLAAR